jgi:hypothetical protein
MTRSRQAARAKWQALSDGQFDRHTLLWLANVATDILKADDIADDNDRRGRIIAAVGLSGRHDPARQTIRDVVAGVDHTCGLIERGSRWRAARPLARGDRNAMRREAVADKLALYDSPEAIDARIKRALAD